MESIEYKNVNYEDTILFHDLMKRNAKATLFGLSYVKDLISVNLNPTIKELVFRQGKGVGFNNNEVSCAFPFAKSEIEISYEKNGFVNIVFYYPDSYLTLAYDTFDLDEVIEIFEVMSNDWGYKKIYF